MDPVGERRHSGLRGEDDADELMLRLMASSGDQEGQQGPWAGTEIRGSRDQPRAHQPAPEALRPLPGSLPPAPTGKAATASWAGPEAQPTRSANCLGCPSTRKQFPCNE